MSNSSINIKSNKICGENLGLGEGVYLENEPQNILNFKSLVGAGTVSISGGTDNIIISGSSSSVGESNSASNVGGGAGIYQTKVDEDLRFKSLISSSSLLTISGGTSEVLFIISGVTETNESLEQLEDLLIHDYFNIGEIKSKYQPILEPQAAITDSLTGLTQSGSTFTPDYNIQQLTNTSPYGFVTLNEAETVLSVIINLQTRVNELEDTLQNLELLQQ